MIRKLAFGSETTSAPALGNGAIVRRSSLPFTCQFPASPSSEWTAWLSWGWDLPVGWVSEKANGQAAQHANGGSACSHFNAWSRSCPYSASAAFSFRFQSQRLIHYPQRMALYSFWKKSFPWSAKIFSTEHWWTRRFFCISITSFSWGRGLLFWALLGKASKWFCFS